MLLTQPFTHHGGPCVTPQTIPQTVLFPDLFDKPLVATFDRQHASSDGGAVLLKAAERVYGLVAGFARCLVDRRELGKIRHTLTELLGQRIFGIACGHPDGNDADHLADDPIHKLLLGRDPVAGEALASQPTISRFENGVGPSALYVLARELAMRVIERHRRRLEGRARRITIDLDPTVQRQLLWRLGDNYFGRFRCDQDRCREYGDGLTSRWTAPSSSPSSTGTTIAGATCRCWRF